MKLSLKKKFGHTHVRGGSVLRVTTEHAVSDRGLNTEAPHARSDMDRWAFAKPGDLAVEVVAVKTKMVLGHSYLSGSAIQCIRYTEAKDDWFEPADAELATLPTPRETEAKTAKEFQESMAAALMRIKYGGADLYGFEYQCERGESAKSVSNAILELFKYAPVDGPTEQASEIIGVVTEGPKKTTVVLHFQKPSNAQDNATSSFGASLLIDSLKRGAK